MIHHERDGTHREDELVGVVTPTHSSQWIPDHPIVLDHPLRRSSREGILYALVGQRWHADSPWYLRGQLDGFEVDQMLVENVEQAILGKRLGKDIVHPRLQVRGDILCAESSA